MKKIIILLLLVIGLLFTNNININAESLNIKDYNNINYNNTNIIGGISVVKRIKSLNELNNVLSNNLIPHDLIFELNDDLNVIFNDEVTNLDTILYMINNKAIPVFSISSNAQASMLIDYLNNIKYYDCFVLSKNADLVKQVRNTLTNIGGIIDYSDELQYNYFLSDNDLINIRKNMHENMANICILPVNLCTKYNIQYLYDSICNVWSDINDNDILDNNPAMIYQGVISGALGIICNDTNTVFDICQNKLNNNSMTRLPLNIAHRGLPKTCPENTIEGAREAYNAGADVIELDIYLTTDNKIVIMHDATTARTCNKDVYVELSSLEELKKLYVNKGYTSDKLYKNCQIPTLEEYLIEFKDKDVRLFIEVKSNKEQIIPLTKELIDKYDMYDQISFISFNTTQLANLNKYFPGSTTGLLINAVINESSTESDFIKVKNNIGKTNSTLNPSKDGYGQNCITLVLSRGISVYPWTFNTKDEYTKYFMYGYSGLTGNDCRILGDFDKSLIVKYENPRYVVGDSISFDVSTIKYNKTTSNITNYNIMLLNNERDDVINNNIVTFTKSGVCDLLISYDVKIDENITYTIYSDVISINVSKQENNNTNTGCNSNTILIILTTYILSSCIYLILKKY